MRTLDHIVFNTRDQMDEVVALFAKLGFFVTARGHHTLGSINHTVVFEDDYLELLGYPVGAPPSRRPELVTRPAGLMATVLGTADADATHNELLDARLAPRLVQTFSRPVDLPDGSSADAAFRVTRLEPDAVPGTWMYFCQHLTPELVWRPEWQSHANGAAGICMLEIDVPDLLVAAPLYATCLAAFSIPAPNAGVVTFRTEGFELRLTERDGPARMRAIAFGVPSLGPAETLLLDAGLASQRDDKTLTVDPASTLGTTLQFTVQAR